VTGSLVLAAFEYTTVQPDEIKFVYEEIDESILLPEIPEDIKETEPQPPKAQPRVVNMNNLQNLQVVQHVVDPNATTTTTDPNITFTEGWGDPTDGIYLGIEDDGSGGTIHEWVDENPEFPGGETAMMTWLSSNIQYPELCAEMGIQGMSYVEFVVNTDGSICQVKGLQSPHEMLTAESMRVVKKMPKWKPGEQAGKKVRVRYTIPINYVLH
jgi:protein TonB